MKINLTLDFPEAKTKNDVRGFCQTMLRSGSENALIDYKVIDFKIYPAGEEKDG